MFYMYKCNIENVLFDKVLVYLVVGDGLSETIAVQMQVDGTQLVQHLLRFPTVLVGVAHLTSHNRKIII